MKASRILTLSAWTSVTLAAALLLLSGCGRGKPVLHVYNWSDYMNPEVVRQFEKQFGCVVSEDNFDSNEVMYAKLKAGGGGYDLIFPSSYMAAVMQQQGMLQPIDHQQVPNLRHVDTDFLSMTPDKTMAYSVPYMISITGIGYNQKRLGEIDPSWRVFENSELAGRMTMLADMREVLGAALKTLGYSLNSTDEAQLAEARDLVIRWKKNLAKFETQEAHRGLASEEFFASQAYNGDVMQVLEENDNVVFAVPREGSSICSDDMVIPIDASQPALAHAFINFLHDPEVCARNMEYVYYRAPNTAAAELVSEEVRKDPAVFASAEVMAKCEVILDLGEKNALYTAVWDEIRAAE